MVSVAGVRKLWHERCRAAARLPVLGSFHDWTGIDRGSFREKRAGGKSGEGIRPALEQEFGGDSNAA